MKMGGEEKEDSFHLVSRYIFPHLKIISLSICMQLISYRFACIYTYVYVYTYILRLCDYCSAVIRRQRKSILHSLLHFFFFFHARKIVNNYLKTQYTMGYYLIFSPLTFI